MNALEFLEAVQSRVDWMKDYAPELLEREVFALEDDRSGPIVDVFVEEFLLVRTQRGDV